MQTVPGVGQRSAEAAGESAVTPRTRLREAPGARGRQPGRSRGKGADEDLERLRPGFSKFDENHSFPRSSPGAAGSTHACNPGNLMTEFLKIGEEHKILKAAKEK